MAGNLTEPPRESSARDRFLAWLVTGRPARLASFALDFTAALGRGLRRLVRGG